MIIGLCGKSGSGKTTLAKEIIELTNNKAVHLDIDKVGHTALTIEETKKELVKAFGSSIIDNNIINRQKLSKIVFSSTSNMDKLTLITWPIMERIIDEFIINNKDKIIILDWQLLPKTKFFNLCDYKVLLDIPYKIRLERALKRDNITEEAFLLRESSSINYNPHDFQYILTSNPKENIRKLVLTNG